MKRQSRKRIIKAEVYAVLVDKGLLPHFQNTPKIPEQLSQFVDDAVRVGD